MLHQVTQTIVGENATQSTQQADQPWVSAVTPDLLSVLMVVPERMAISALHAYIQHLEENLQDSKRYRIAFWGKLAFPLSAIVMLMLALVFAFHPPRHGGTGGRLLTGIMLGLGFYLSSRVAGQVALLQDWPVALPALLPILLFGISAFAALWWIERR